MKKEYKKRPAFAVGVLLIITIFASASAFFWLETVKKKVHTLCGESYEGVCIESINYDSSTNDIVVTLFNGKEEPVKVLNSEVAGVDTTYVSMMTGAATGFGCEYVPLGKLACDPKSGVCNGFIKSKEIVEVHLKGTRSVCKIPSNGEYKLQINFGLEDQIREQFSV